MGTLLRSLPDVEAAALSAMLADEAWQAETIAKAVASEVRVPLKGGTVARHRRGGCSCEPV